MVGGIGFERQARPFDAMLMSVEDVKAHYPDERDNRNGGEEGYRSPKDPFLSAVGHLSTVGLCMFNPAVC
jgi:hypothetical protein